MNEKCPFCELLSDDPHRHVWDWHMLGYALGGFRLCWCRDEFKKLSQWRGHLANNGEMITHYLEQQLGKQHG